MSAQPQHDDGGALQALWVAVIRVDKVLWVVGPLPAQNAALAMARVIEGWPGAERVGLAELVAPGEAHARFSAARAERGAGGVLRPLPRDGRTS